VRVLLIVIDGAAPRVFCPAVQTGRLPSLKRLADAGRMHDASVTIFPSITPAATTSIVTGAYPAESGIAGASWYDDRKQEVAYYGDDFWTIAKEGFGTFLRDFLLHLNGDRLRAPTLFEMVEQAGHRAASINYLVYRGRTEHRVEVPWLLSALPGVPSSVTVCGPSILCLGDFVARAGPGKKLSHRGGILHRLGMDDASTAVLLRELTETGLLGDFTLAYFADNDYQSHDAGPHAALTALERIDDALASVFDAAGGLEAFLRDTCVIVTSDHGHCEVLPDADGGAIRLDDILQEFRQADLGRAWRDGDEIMICPNLRAAQIYIRESPHVTPERIARAALVDRRIDLAIRRHRAADGGITYVVESQRGRLEFWPAADGSSGHGVDAFGTAWCWRGEPAALGLEMDGRTISSAEYPNPLERIAGALDAPNSGELWLTASPGHEFQVPGGKPHVGGASHGALHALDSLSPVIVAGAGAPSIPRSMRVVDLAPMCAQVLALPIRYRVGQARVRRSPS
jgi:hypothetical protein